jgi:hypothetical protein
VLKRWYGYRRMRSRSLVRDALRRMGRARPFSRRRTRSTQATAQRQLLALALNLRRARLLTG